MTTWAACFFGTTKPDFPISLILNTQTESPESIAVVPTTKVFSPLTGAYNNRAHNNMGVPGAKSYHLIAPGYGDPAG